MKATEITTAADAGRVPWTRDLARDLFPGPATPFAWTLLAAPAETALRSLYADLGAPVVSADPFWRLADGYVYLNADLIAAADEKLFGAAWLGPVTPQGPSGLFGKMQAGGVIKRAEGRLRAAHGEAAGLRTRLLRWLAWVQGLRWTQADVLQVMEELEPHAVSALHVFFLARAALNAAVAALETRLAEWLPDLSSQVRANLYLAIDGLPSVEAALALLDAAQLPAAHPDRLAALARFGHRGPGEMRPDATRWADTPALFESLAARAGARERLLAAQTARKDAEAAVFSRLGGGQARQFDELRGRAHEAVRAVSAAWDALTAVMAAAQRWTAAAGREALLAGLIARPEDALYLELEELKQVATGEWHEGRSAEAQAEVLRRISAPAQLAETSCVEGPVEVVPGQRDGPLYAERPACAPPPQGSVWLAETFEPGCLALWCDAAALLAAGCDAWTPGLIAARGLGVPAVAGADTRDGAA